MLIAHATDLTGDDRCAFIHAAALAAVSGAKLVTLHAGAPRKVTPDAAGLAVRWRRAIDYEFRYVESCDDPADTLLDALHSLQPSLVVLGTHGRHGLAALLRGSVGEAIARNLDVPTLIVPDTAGGFADPTTGQLRLRRILIPVGIVADAGRGMDAARRFASFAGVEEPVIDLVHVGRLEGSLENLGVTRIAGVLEDAIVQAARRCDASLIVMPTRGHDSVGDMLAGSHTERVIHDTDRPVLAVPF